MFSYYVKLAMISLKRTPLLSFLMVMLIAMGIGATMTTYTVNYMMSQDPIPSKSDNLYSVQIDSRGDGVDYSYLDTIPPEMTYQDAMNILKSDIPKYQAVISAIRTTVKNPAKHDTAVTREVRTTSADFFPMLEVPFLYGRGWDETADSNAEQVVVLTKQANMRFFDGENSIGRTLQLGEDLYQVVGVLDDWLIVPKFYGQNNDMYSNPFDIFMPFRTQVRKEIFTTSLINIACWKPAEDESTAAFLASECTWIKVWAELENDEKKQQFQLFLDNYAQQQQTQGRFTNRILNKLVSVKQYLSEEKIVPEDSKIAVWLAALFLIVCLLNCMGLMMAKFHGKAGEAGLRRAVGASRQHLIAQFSVELAVVGFIGGVFGLLLAQLGLVAMTNLYSHLHSSLMQMNALIVIATLALAVVISCVFGLIPILKASRVQLSSQLKSL